MPLSITSKLQVLARECNTSGLITSKCNQSQLLPNRQAPRFLTGFADDPFLITAPARGVLLASISMVRVSSLFITIVWLPKARTLPCSQIKLRSCLPLGLFIALSLPYSLVITFMERFSLPRTPSRLPNFRPSCPSAHSSSSSMFHPLGCTLYIGTSEGQPSPSSHCQSPRPSVFFYRTLPA